ncbi:TonB-dependent receptor [Thalassotalea sp. HSM 43]|uniref:TonB-dependent receptor n=1 Tax=Thalassotalea sp. HSM 43 TaxID=2552945 RepID=UPI001E558E03|nr:TonB-dependent receptor [Thalassotalea sp. HSM 43]
MSVKTKSAAGNALFRKSVLANTVAAAMVLSSSQAIAQEQTEEEAIDDVIVVTAQKRSQNVMKVPVTVDTVSAETIKESGSILLSDVDKFIPGFDFSDGNMTQAGVTMRGVSSPNISVGGDPSSATFFDNVYMPRAAQNVLFSDMQRIEVLKGPQGTLFGKNAAMGVVNMVPNAPQEEFDAFVKGTFGTDNLMRLEGMVNFSLTDNIYLRANVLTNEQDGFIDNITRADWNEGTKTWDLGARDHNAARVAIKWDVSDRTNVQVSYDWDELEQAPPMAVGFSEYAYKGGSDPFGSKQENDVRKGVESRDMYAVTFKLNHEFNDEWSMMFVSSYRDWDTVNREDEDGTANITRYLDTSNNEDSDIFYNELQINYNTDRLNYVGGITYSKEDVFQETEIFLTTDTVARLVTGELNGQVRGEVGNQVEQTLIDQGLVDAFEGDLDAAAAYAACVQQGAPDPTVCIGQISFDDVVDETYAASGLEMDHMWNSDEWSDVLVALTGDSSLTPEFVAATGDLTYMMASAMFNEPLIFGPSFSTGPTGMFWSENFLNSGEFTSYGIYSDFDFQLTDAWNVFAGLRYSKDEKDFTWEILETPFAQIIPGVSNVLFAPLEKTYASDSWDKVTGRIGTGYQLNDDHMVFASFATGYKAGGYDSLNPITDDNGNEPFEPEESANLEIGYKGVFADSVRITAAFYHTELDDRQRNIESKPPGQAQALPTVVNEDLVIDGIELGVIWDITDTMTFGVVTDYRENEVDTEEFYNSSGDLIPAMKVDNESNTSYTLTFDWMPDLGLGDTKLHIDYVFVENERGFFPGTPDWERALPNYFDDREDLNARASWMNSSGSLEIGIWGKNLLDNRYIEGAGGRTASVLGTPFGRVNRGLESGVDIKYTF